MAWAITADPPLTRAALDALVAADDELYLLDGLPARNPRTGAKVTLPGVFVFWCAHPDDPDEVAFRFEGGRLVADRPAADEATRRKCEAMARALGGRVVAA